MDNRRMKDYFDLHYLTKTQAFDGAVMALAIQSAFHRRNTPLPRETPAGLLPAFGADTVKQTQWRAFLRKLRAQEGALSLEEVVAELQGFLMPPVNALLQKQSFGWTWPPAGPWRRE